MGEHSHPLTSFSYRNPTRFLPGGWGKSQRKLSRWGWLPEENSTRCEIHPDLFPLSPVQNKRLNPQGEGLKTQGLRTPVSSLQQGKRNRGKRKSSIPGGGAGNPLKDPLKAQVPVPLLSLRLNKIITKRPPPSPATTWQTSYMVSNSGIQLGGL